MNKVVRLFGFSFIFYSIIVGFTFTLQKAFILHPDRLKGNYEYSFDYPFKEINLSNEGQTINGLHFFASNNVDKKVIVYYHGNADNLKRWGNYAEDFLKLGYDVIMMDYRGFGKSSGKANEWNMYSDGMLFYNYARTLFAEENIVLYGRSIGSGVATEIATKVKAASLLLETPFYSIEDVIQTRFPFLWIPGELHFKFENGDKFKNISMPIHIFHGTKDRIVPIHSANKLQKYLKVGDSFTTIPKGKHKNLSNFSQFHEALAKVL